METGETVAVKKVLQDKRFKVYVETLGGQICIYIYIYIFIFIFIFIVIYMYISREREIVGDSEKQRERDRGTEARECNPPDPQIPIVFVCIDMFVCVYVKGDIGGKEIYIEIEDR